MTNVITFKPKKTKVQYKGGVHKMECIFLHDRVVYWCPKCKRTTQVAVGVGTDWNIPWLVNPGEADILHKY